MPYSKSVVLRKARIKLDALMALLLLLYGGLGYATYPGTLLLWINMGVLSTIIFSTYIVVRLWIGRMIGSIEAGSASP